MKTIKTNIEPNNYLAPHFISRSNWLRAAVLGANDGCVRIIDHILKLEQNENAHN